CLVVGAVHATTGPLPASLGFASARSPSPQRGEGKRVRGDNVIITGRRISYVGRSLDTRSPLPDGERGSKHAANSMSVINSIRSQLAPIHPQGYPFIGGFALASLVLFILCAPLGWLGTVATLWCAYFFRDPIRVTPIAEGLVVSPTDGRVSIVVNAVPPPELALGTRPLPRVSIFMSVSDCHVNRP